ncbi:MAG: alkaline phosphatase family protein, partial [Patescibacteria group bacterium]|nr:alkaline phosphatase family protein [Patescibacteria group bacterium]
MIKKIIQKFYNQKLEDFCTRVLYFFNTLDTYFFISGIFSFLFIFFTKHPTIDPFYLVFALCTGYLLFKLSDFYPSFLAFSPFFLFFLAKFFSWNLSLAILLLLVNIIFFVIVQFLFMGIPDSIISRNPKTSIKKLYLSIQTIAPTTVSLVISVYFATLFSYLLYFQPKPFELMKAIPLWISLWIAAFICNKVKPKSFVSPKLVTLPLKKKFAKVIVLNIDGCRLDRFHEAKLPFLTQLQKRSTYYPKGLQTVYRALTNPAFASILTGTIPEVHGVINNNLGQVIKVEGLPDIVKTKLYGSMHVKHFSKENWETKIISLPTLSIYKTDDEMFRLLKEDLMHKDNTRLFVADLSEVDFLGHAFGSESKEYLQALKRADKRIEKFFQWLKTNHLEDKIAIIICSDHGICKIDHSYLLCSSEKYVPFIAYGEGIPVKEMNFEASIMDISATISYLLGIKETQHCQGRVLVNLDENQFRSPSP